MTEINLLPWREYKRQEDKKHFMLLMLSCILAAMVLVFLINGCIVRWMDNQKERNELLQTEVALFNGQIKELTRLKQNRAALIAKMLVVDRLQSSKVLTVRLFDALIRVMPPGAYATELDRQGDVVTLWGYADSNTRVSLLMKNIDKDAWIQAPVLGEIKKMDDEKQQDNYLFKLSFLLKPKTQTGNAS